MAEFHVIAGASERLVYPAVRKIRMSDLSDCLRRGAEDFWEKPSHYAFVALIYPVAGIIFAYWTSGNNALPLLYPLMAGFALVGPFAAIGLYEISRRREMGIETSWRHALEVRRSPARYSIAVVGMLLAVIFLLWLYAASALYNVLFGSVPPETGAFVRDVFTTREGWILIILGNAVGLVFAVIALAASVVAFPLLLDRDVGAYAAVHSSVRAFMRNPLEILAWGLIVAVLLVIGMVPLFAGLAVVLPILGHASWHLYRKLIARPLS
ncbi:DUF2189 domain-containing protein [Chelativorans sp. AA-79]|uniref:DUF2189 domain-containing protein n=1 Tax=Chelativorans sp. AA-79 TaxID=3028735 RepID=UPI0023F936A2|nr:DUF2189 domain-containing protein [Chelativorans sp. AA-79]WEX09072.1 DUF2189 domain-containing protein [Chelativorans sp. AA-79]